VHPSPSPAEADRPARLLRLRLLRQVRLLERGRIDRFLSLSEALRRGFPDLLPGLSGASPALIRECQALLSAIEDVAGVSLERTEKDLVRLEIDRKIREFLAKKEEP
jgi:hypothetical protein